VDAVVHDPGGLGERARIVLLFRGGASSASVRPRVGVSLQTVHSWRVRYATGGLAALDNRPRSGPVVHDEQAIIAATLEAPQAALGVTHSSARLLAD